MRAGSRSRRRSGRGRAIVLGALVVATAAIAAWFFVLSPSSPPSGTFVVARDRYADAVDTITAQAAITNRKLDFAEFNTVFDSSVATMSAERDVFRRLAAEEEGEAAQIATDAADAAALGISSAELFRTALSRLRIADADAARRFLESAVHGLDRQAEAWLRL